MKIFFLFLLTITLAFSSDKKIILGSYVKKTNSSNALTKVKHVIKEDKILHKLIELNHLTVQVKKIGQYHTVTVATLTSYVQLLRTMKAFRKYYADLYVLPPYKATVVTTATTSANKVVQTVTQEVIKETHEDVKLREVTKNVQKSKNSIKKESVHEATPIPKKPTITKEEPAEQKTLSTTQTILTIAIVVILLIILLGVFLKTTRSTKEDNNKSNL